MQQFGALRRVGVGGPQGVVSKAVSPISAPDAARRVASRRRKHDFAVEHEERAVGGVACGKQRLARAQPPRAQENAINCNASRGKRVKRSDAGKPANVGVERHAASTYSGVQLTQGNSL